MKSNVAIPLRVLVATLLVFLSKAQDFDFFYLVQQWPGSYCDTKQSCCYPTTGKPAADFGIHGFWPNYNDGSYPSNCDPNSPFNPSETMVATRASQRAARDCLRRLFDSLGHLEAWSSLHSRYDEVFEALSRLGADSRSVLQAIRNISLMASTLDEHREAILGFIGDSSFPEELTLLEAAEPPLADSFLALWSQLNSLKKEKRAKKRYLAWLVPLAEAEFPDRRASIWRRIRAVLNEYDDLAIDVSIMRNWANAEYVHFDLVQQCISHLMDLTSKEARVQAKVDELKARLLPLLQD